MEYPLGAYRVSTMVLSEVLILFLLEYPLGEETFGTSKAGMLSLNPSFTGIPARENYSNAEAETCMS